MIPLQANWGLYANILMGLILLGSVISGLKVGFLRTLINLLRQIIALIVAFLFAKPLANVFPLLNFKTSGIMDEITKALATEGSAIIWFVIVYFGVIIVTMMLNKLFEFVEDIPIIGWFNMVVGGVLGFIIGWIKLMVLCIVLTTPLFKNGQELIDQSWLKTVSNTAQFIEPLKNSKIFQKINDHQKINDQEAGNLEDLLTKYNLNQQQLTQFLERLKK